MISFDHVTKRYPHSADPALDDVSVELERGDFAFLIGASGSGKSTLLQLITRQLRANSGTIMVAGRDVQRLPERNVPGLRREIGVVFQDFRLLENKTVYQNVAFALQVLGTKRFRIKQAVTESLELVGLDGKAKRRPHELSGGEQQRVAIARAMVKKPKILLADEPTGNLDPDTSDEIVRVLQRINKTGTTLLVATHDQRIVDEFTKRVLELRGGVLVRDEEGGKYADPADIDGVRRRRPARETGD